MEYHAAVPFDCETPFFVLCRLAGKHPFSVISRIQSDGIHGLFQSGIVYENVDAVFRICHSYKIIYGKCGVGILVCLCGYGDVSLACLDTFRRAVLF